MAHIGDKPRLKVSITHKYVTHPLKLIESLVVILKLIRSQNYQLQNGISISSLKFILNLSACIMSNIAIVGFNFIPKLAMNYAGL